MDHPADVRVNLNNLPALRHAEEKDTCFLPPLD
jgi:hypothetical protein